MPAAIAMSFGLGSTSYELYLLVALLSLVAIVFSRNKRAMILACFIALFAIPVLKGELGQERPCAGMIFCPTDLGMPSGHTTFVFIFAAGSLGSPAFYFFYPTAILVALSRIDFGVHSTVQVAAGAGLGCALFFISKELLIACGHIRGEKIHWRVKRFVSRKARNSRYLSGKRN